METLVDQDFEFNKISLIYGKFLQEVHESYPGAVITDIASYYQYKDSNTMFLHVAVPESLAVVLKLRFGVHLRNRPPPKPAPKLDILSEKETSWFRKVRYEEEMRKEKFQILKHTEYLCDYLDILKTREVEKLYNEIKMENIYLNLKSLPKDWLDEK